MELRHFRYFIAAAEELNFRRAAGRLGIAQAALSMQIRALEDELGVRLLDRNRRRVSLTGAGSAFLEKARAALALASDAARAAQDAGRGEIGRLSIGFVTSALYGIFPDIVRHFRQRFPLINLQLQELSVAQQGEMLRAGGIDVSFLRPPLDERGLVVRTIRREHWVVAMPVTHPAARRRVVPLKTLANDRFVLFPRALAPNIHDGILAACQKAGFSPNIVIEAQMHTLVGLVSAGMGVALVPESMQNLQRKGLAYRPLKESSMKIALAVAWRDEEIPAVLRSFLDVVAEVA